MEQTNLVVSEVTARREAIHRLLVETTGLSDALHRDRRLRPRAT